MVSLFWEDAVPPLYDLTAILLFKMIDEDLLYQIHSPTFLNFAANTLKNDFIKWLFFLILAQFPYN